MSDKKDIPNIAEIVKKSIEDVKERSASDFDIQATLARLKDISKGIPAGGSQVKLQFNSPEEFGVISPELESELFGYYFNGVNLKTIAQKYGSRYNFRLKDLQKCADKYQWNEQINAIFSNKANKRIDDYSQKCEDYCNFLDDIISEAMARFVENVKTGKTDGTFCNLRIENIRDLKDAMSMFMELKNGGVKKIDVTHHKLDDDKASRILEIMADDTKEGKIVSESDKELEFEGELDD